MGAIFVLGQLLGGCALISLLGIWLAARWYLHRARAAYLAEGRANADLAEQLAATVPGARTIEALGLQRSRMATCEAAIDACRRTQARTLFLRSVLFPAVDTAYALPLVGALLVGGALHEHGVMGLGAVVSTALYLRQLSQPLDVILGRLEQLQNGGASFARVEGLADAAQLAPPTAPSEVSPSGDLIELTDVYYAYEGGEDVLRGVSLAVRSGERLAIVGTSGADKSTLSRLLAGIDSPREGTVTVGGVPIAGLAPAQLRRQIVLVTQEQHVFLGTIRDNLRIAAESATDTELDAALTVVGAGWVGELPDGLSTVVGAGGHELDGPQAQQLAMARVVPANPHTVILDEATALLDPGTARQTERALAKALEGRTVVAVAYRLHTAHDADRIAVVDQGRVVEFGPHDKLVRAGGVYASLWRSWHSDPGLHRGRQRARRWAITGARAARRPRG